MSYGNGAFAYADANGYSSDDPLALLAPVPCTLGAVGPAQVAGAHHVVAVRPNAGDAPSPRRIELWGEAAPGGHIDRAWFALFAPDGSPVTAVDAAPRQGAACVGPIGMYAAAQRTGQLGQAVVGDASDGLEALCASGRAALYRAPATVGNTQPCGEYRIDFHVSAAGKDAVLTSFMDVACTIQMAVGFTGVDWGRVAPNATLKARARAAERLVVTNLGNAGAAVTVNFGPLTSGTDGITSFGVGFDIGGARLAMVDPVAAGVPVTFGDRDELLRSGASAALELFLHTGPHLAIGQYSGQLTLELSAVPP